jgi:addiction module HigA family antidote
MIPKNRQPNHPGEILRDEFLLPLGLTQTALAEHLGWSHARVNEIIHGRRGISSEAALSLADTSGTTPDLWMNLQANYDLYRAARFHRKKPVLAKESEPRAKYG